MLPDDALLGHKDAVAPCNARERRMWPACSVEVVSSGAVAAKPDASSMQATARKVLS